MTTFPPVPADLFRFTTTAHAELHTAVMRVFGVANERLQTVLTADDVQQRLRNVGWSEQVTDDELQSSLNSLRGWGLLDAAQHRYGLTRLGEAACAGLKHALDTLSGNGSLQTAVLDAIAAHLDDLAKPLDDRGAFTALTQLEGHLDAFETGTTRFNADLQRLLRDEQTDLATFQDVKRTTITYLRDFIADLDARKQRIREAIAGIDATELHERARNGAGLHQSDELWLRQRKERWSNLKSWFHDNPPRVDELQDVSRKAIVQLLRVLDRISEQRKKPTNTAADLRALARWFARTETEDEAHELFNAAFGLWPARHAHLAHADGELLPSGEAWHNTPPVPVSPQLRATGKQEHIGATGKVRNVDEVRRNRREQAEKERAELEYAWSQIQTDGAIRISTLTNLDHDTFHRLIDLVGRALGSDPDSTGTRTAGTSDGRMQINLRNARGWATMTTQKGTLSGPDYVIDVQSR
ncbi:TIGR02677 family protein [Lentzea sp. BCCO 10_0061]|uniref:TIGR02677 family protein n=1 Tax=Lentzea sokolovensis TaxID=3095429 RepID=A0ABU4V569_9PSEU|nr:TIGR02677 family protein [Lentzea sp. BCCO 10_0061]MDX8146045.1 TIGR02677 family protein [Lentzea sp. BCCO 10_0061]